MGAGAGAGRGFECAKPSSRSGRWKLVKLMEHGTCYNLYAFANVVGALWASGIPVLVGESRYRFGPSLDETLRRQSGDGFVGASAGTRRYETARCALALASHLPFLLPSPAVCVRSSMMSYL